MEIRYKLNAEDYLSFQLFAASKSERIRRKKLFQWVFTTALFLALAQIFYLMDQRILFYYFLVCGIGATFFMPFYTKYRYRKHFLRHINDVYRDNFGKEVKIFFDKEKESVEMLDDGSESSVKYTAFKEINEIPTHYFIHFMSGHALIIPKGAIEDSPSFEELLKEISEKHTIAFNKITKK